MQNTSQKLFNMLVSKDFKVKTLTAMGKETDDIDDTEMFSFDFAPGNKNYGAVVILLNGDEDLEVFYGDNIGKTMERSDKKIWMDFLQQIRIFSKRNMMGFSLNDISKLKYSMKGMAAIKEGLFEGYYGTKKTSYNPQGKSRIIIKHSKPVQEGGRRYYNISSLFVENADGERFKLPFKRLAGARAMAQHVTEGGNPYDPAGQYISHIVKEIDTLAGFNRRARMFEEDDTTAQYVMAAKDYYQSLRKKLKSFTHPRGYHKFFDEWDPAAIDEQEGNVDEIRRLFTEKSVNSKVDDALPIIARLAGKIPSVTKEEEETDMDEVTEFKSWADDMVNEGEVTTEEQVEELRNFMSEPQPLGIDALNVTDKLYELLDSDELLDELTHEAEKNPDADAREIVGQWLKHYMPQLWDRVNVDVAEEGLDKELDADNEQQLNAEINKERDEHCNEDGAVLSQYGLEQLSPELRNAISDGLVSVYDILNNTIGFQPGEEEMAILQQAYKNIASDIGSDDYDTVCNAMTEVIEDLQNEAAHPAESQTSTQAVTESLDSLLALTNSLLTR